MNRLLLLLVSVFAFSISSACAQDNRYHPLRIQETISLDGRLDETGWKQADLVDSFMQYDPVSGGQPTARTEVRILYDNDYLYAGIRAYDPHPELLVSKYLERDFAQGEEDAIAFVVDTYNDKSTGLAFIGNLLNARRDEEFSADGQSYNSDYNTFWDVKSQVDSSGFTSEFRIPFSSLRFETKDTVIMGFRVVRNFKRLNEYCIYPACDPKIDNAYFKVSLAQEMEFHDLRSHKPFYFIPYAIANYYGENVLNTSETAYENKSEFLPGKDYFENETLDKILSNIGCDIKYGLTKNLTLDLTVNTDFAQAEADDVIINLSKYEVNLPEKRTFFLESQNYLNYSTTTDNQLFISRSIGRENDLIVPIIAGARITGKSNGWQTGFLEMQTLAMESDSIPAHNFFVLRTRKNTDLRGSFIGGIFTNRINTSGEHRTDQTLALDVVNRFNDHVTLVGALASTTVNADLKELASKSDYNVGLYRSAKEGLRYGFSADLIGKDFSPVMGFVEENNLGNVSASTAYSWQAKEESKVAYWYAGEFLGYKWKLTSGQEEWKAINAEGGIIFKNEAELNLMPFSYSSDVLFEAWAIAEHITIPTGTYPMITANAGFLSTTTSHFKYNMLVSGGDFYDGTRWSVNPGLTFNLNKHFFFSVEYEYNHIDFPDAFSDNGNGLFVSNLLRFNASYYFSSQVSVKLLTQYDDLNNQLTSNLRFRYNPREGTDLYIVFNQGLNSNRYRMEPTLPVLNNQAVTVKFVKTFAF